jgi:hypothetical protein
MTLVGIARWQLLLFASPGLILKQEVNALD